MDKTKYSLPKLSYALGDLAPHISEQQLKIHYEIHHKGYVDNANAIIEKIEKARTDKTELDMKSTIKSLNFNVSGHILHSYMWENLTPKSKKPVATISKAIDNEFGSFERFKAEFNQAAINTEGSGWAALVYCKMSSRLLIMQIEKHNVNIYPGLQLLLVLDVWEHAYYIDYKNARAKFVEAFWNIIDWETVAKRYSQSI